MKLFKVVQPLIWLSKTNASLLFAKISMRTSLRNSGRLLHSIVCVRWMTSSDSARVYKLNRSDSLRCSKQRWIRSLKKKSKIYSQRPWKRISSKQHRLLGLRRLSSQKTKSWRHSGSNRLLETKAKSGLAWTNKEQLSSHLSTSGNPHLS